MQGDHVSIGEGSIHCKCVMHTNECTVINAAGIEVTY